MTTSNKIFRSMSIVHRHGMTYMKKHFFNEEVVKSHPPFLITIIKNKGISQDTLAKKLHFDKGAVARIVKAMISNGYIIRETDPNDKRRYNLYPTKKGEKLIPMLKEAEIEYEAVITKGMTDEQVAVFQSLLEKASENIINATSNYSEENSSKHCEDFHKNYIVTTSEENDKTTSSSDRKETK